MPLLTPERPASSSSDQPRPVRNARTCSATAALSASAVPRSGGVTGSDAVPGTEVSVTTLSSTVIIVLRITDVRHLARRSVRPCMGCLRLLRREGDAAVEPALGDGAVADPRPSDNCTPGPG